MNETFSKYLNSAEELGYVKAADLPLVYLSGLPYAKPQELVMFETGAFGQVLSLRPDTVEVLMMSNDHLTLGSRVVRLNSEAAVEVGEHQLGRVIDPFGLPLYRSQSGAAEKSETRPIDAEALPIAQRRQIKDSFFSGVAVVDLMVPLGQGQRQLLIGDRQTGKSSFAQQVMLNQAQLGTICIYACIGKKKADIKNAEEFFTTKNVLKNIIIVASSADDPLGVIYTTPYAAMTIAEYFRDQGKNVLLVLDDMTTHAAFYRQISLLAKRFPGRNSYPGDIFYVHSKLLERAGSFTRGSITCLPIVNTTESDISGYIQTNLMSMTDGHVFFDRDLFYSGQRPAINTYLSVTRVGRQTQTPLRRAISRELSSFFGLYKRTQNFVHFGAELNEGIKSTLQTGDRILTLFRQTADSVVDLDLQITLFCIIWSGNWNNKSDEELRALINKVRDNFASKQEFRNMMRGLIDTAEDFNVLLRNFMQKFAANQEYFT